MHAKRTHHTPDASSILDVTRNLQQRINSEATGPLLTVDKLIAKFGYGDRKQLRLRAYRRIIAIVNASGPPAAKLVADVARRAHAADDPGRYFVCVAPLRLSEQGFSDPQ